MTDSLRLLSFRRESIEKSIFTQDIIDAKKSDIKIIYSVYLKERD